MGHTAHLGALTIGSVRDQVRRPGFATTVGLVAVLFAILPRLGNPAAGVMDNARLACELGLSSSFLVAVTWASVQAAQVMRPPRGDGPMAELLSIPRGARTVVLATWGSATAAGITLALASTILGSVGWWGTAASSALPTLDAWLLTIVTTATAVALGAGLGVFYGTVATRELALVAVVVHLAGARALASQRQLAESWWVELVPDPLRLDVAREIAFGRAVGWDHVGVGIASAAVQIAAVLLLSATRLRPS